MNYTRWRIAIYKVDSAPFTTNNSVTLAGLRVLDESMADMSAGASIVASSGQGSVGNLLDGNPSSIWGGTLSYDPLTLDFNLVSPANIKFIEMTGALTNWAATTPVAFAVFASNGGSVWESISLHVPGSWTSAGQVRVMDIPAPLMSASKWAVIIGPTSNMTSYGVGELEFHDNNGAALLSGASLTTFSPNANSQISNLTDGNLTTYWSSADSPVAGILINTPASITPYKIGWYRPAGMGNVVSPRSVYAGVDGINYSISSPYAYVDVAIWATSTWTYSLLLGNGLDYGVGNSVDYSPDTNPALLSAGLDYGVNYLQVGLDYSRYGSKVVSGTVTINGLAARRKVYLIDLQTQMILRSVMSDEASGYYEFRGVPDGRRYTVLSRDHNETYNAVVADFVEPE